MSTIVRVVLLLFVSDISCQHHIHSVNTTLGLIQGVVRDNVRYYLGIPYATAERFRPPIRMASLKYIFNANRMGPMCYQNCPPSPAHLCLKQMSEDCLSLNVWTPNSEPEGDGFAVMVFIHGGNFVAYSGSSPLFDGSALAKRGSVVMVTINYRLGAFGFLSHTENDRIISGNNGLLDQELAIEWIHDNIHAFGGDKNKVTLFGQSAGAESIIVHLASRKVSDYFQRAIIQSCPLNLPLKNTEEAKKQAQVFLEKLGCNYSDVECLKNKSSEEIQQAQEKTASDGYTDQFLMKFQSWGPVLDGDLITDNLLPMAENISSNKDIIIGTVSGEGIAYIQEALPQELPGSLFQFYLGLVFNDSSSVAALYEAGTDAHDALSMVATDYVFYCPSRKLADHLSSRGNVWFYDFDQPLSFNGWGNGSVCNVKVCHGGDLPFLFDTPRLVGYNTTSDDDNLTSKMIAYWTNFAKYGNPNHGSVDPEWPKYESMTDQIIILKEPRVHVAKADRDAECAILNKQQLQSDIINTLLDLLDG